MLVSLIAVPANAEKFQMSNKRSVLQCYSDLSSLISVINYDDTTRDKVAVNANRVVN